MSTPARAPCLHFKPGRLVFMPAAWATPPTAPAPAPAAPNLDALTPACPSGRRGKDDKGLVFLMVDDALDEDTAR